jgi:cell division protein FtsL
MFKNLKSAQRRNIVSMGNKRKAISALIVAILFVSAITGTIFYYNGIIDSKNSKITSLNNEIANLKNEMANLTSQISNLKGQVANLSGQVTNLTSANIETALGITEVPYDSPHNMPSPMQYSHLHITGSVNNTGQGTAYNAGLDVVAYDADGALLLNMTVPLDNGAVFGTDTQINSYLTDNYYSLSSTQLSILYSGQTATIVIDIFHEGTFSNSSSYKIMPVWTNSP